MAVQESTEQMKKWLNDMTKATERRVTITENATTTVTVDNGLRAIEKMMEPGFFEGIMTEFLENEVVGPEGALTKQFSEALTSPDKYQPHVFGYEPRIKYDPPSGRTVGGQVTDRIGNDDGDVAVDNQRTLRELPNVEAKARKGISAMFRDVFAVMKKIDVWRQGDQIYGGVGPLSELMQMALGPYMPVQGSFSASAGSGLNSLFLAVEYGTGVADNVGGSQWVRHEGNTKEREFVGYEGAWWRGRKRKRGGFSGMLFTGQKGVHFLDEKETRQPLPIYLYRLQQRMPEMLIARLSK